MRDSCAGRMPAVRAGTAVGETVTPLHRPEDGCLRAARQIRRTPTAAVLRIVAGSMRDEAGSRRNRANGSLRPPRFHGLQVCFHFAEHAFQALNLGGDHPVSKRSQPVIPAAWIVLVPAVEFLDEAMVEKLLEVVIERAGP